MSGGATYAALAAVAIIACGFDGAIRLMWAEVHTRLFCAECGGFTDDLTDDDVCHSCASALSRSPSNV